MSHTGEARRILYGTEEGRRGTHMSTQPSCRRLASWGTEYRTLEAVRTTLNGLAAYTSYVM